MYQIVTSRDEFLSEVKKLLPKKNKCLEIGVYQGEFSLKILNSFKPKELYLIDPFNNGVEPLTNQEEYVEHHHKILYSDDKCLMNVYNTMGDSIKSGVVKIDRNLSTDAVGNYNDEYFDFIYIDGCHLYECVKFDLENYFPKLKVGGYIGGHDYGDFGVKDAVDEFCKNNGYEIKLLCSYQGDWLLTPKI